MSKQKYQDKYITHNREPFFELASNYYKKGMRTLDIGPGDGLFAKILDDEHIYLLEGNYTSALELKKSYKNTFHINLPNEFPFESKFFDFIHTSHLVEHLAPSEVYSFMKEIDRVLADNGILVISAPLLWDGFYDDLSHIRPYPPDVFLNYLANGSHSNRTRNVVSDKYEMIDLQYRYLLLEPPDIRLKENYNIIYRFLGKLLMGIATTYMRYYQKTGFTLVLRKQK